MMNVRSSSTGKDMFSIIPKSPPTNFPTLETLRRSKKLTERAATSILFPVSKHSLTDRGGKKPQKINEEVFYPIV